MKIGTSVTRSSRREFVGGVVVATVGTLAAPHLVRAQQRQIVVGGPGVIATPLREHFIGPFERKHNCTVLFEGTRSTTNLEKMRANKARPIMSVVMMDDPVMIPALEEGLLEPLTPALVPNLPRLVPNAIHANGAWINHMFPRAAIAYNTDVLPTGVNSWSMLWEPRFRRRVVIPSLEMTQGIFSLMMAAHLATGSPMSESLKLIDAGFEYLAKLKPNILLIHNNTPQALQLLETQEAHMIGSEVLSSVMGRRAVGAAIDLARPREGSFAMPNGIALIKNAPNMELACAYINEYLTDSSQYLIAEKLLSEPTVAASPVPPGFQRDPNMNFPDWFLITRNRGIWLDRWARTIAT